MEALIKSHRGRCGKNGPRARRLGTSIPTAGCKCQANTAPGLLSPQPGGLKPFVDFCLAVSRRSRPADCFAGYDATPAACRCGVARSGETAAGIDSLAPARLALTGLPAANLPKPLPQLRVAQRSRLQPSLWEEARRSIPKV
jgi:hypothetical protein